MYYRIGRRVFKSLPTPSFELAYDHPSFNRNSAASCDTLSAMSRKRQLHTGEGSSGTMKKRFKLPILDNLMPQQLSTQVYEKFLLDIERIVSRAVKQEIAKQPACKKCHCGQDTPSPSSMTIQLQFSGKLSYPVFTDTLIEGDKSCPLSILLVNSETQEIISEGPLSSMKVELVVLEGDFEGGENWTSEDFKKNIVREREGKRLMVGDMLINLKKGTGKVKKLEFGDNSNWVRSRKFKIGATVENGYFNGIRVQEAVTEAFTVKEHRGRSYVKHYPPALDDEVWRLENIAKGGPLHQRLKKEKICKVKHFLAQLCLDAKGLRDILGSAVSKKKWESTIRHAQTSILSEGSVQYHANGQSTVAVVLNEIGELKGTLTRDNFMPLDELSQSQKEDAHILVKEAYEHWEEVTPLDGGALHGNPSSDPTMSLPSILPQEAVNEHSLSINIMPLPSGVLREVGSGNSSDECTLPPAANWPLGAATFTSLPSKLPQEGVNPKSSLPEEGDSMTSLPSDLHEESVICYSSRIPMRSPDLIQDVHLGDQADCSSMRNWMQIECLLDSPPINASVGVFGGFEDDDAEWRDWLQVPRETPIARWIMLRNLLTWRFALRRYVARRRKEKENAL